MPFCCTINCKLLSIYLKFQLDFSYPYCYILRNNQSQTQLVELYCQVVAPRTVKYCLCIETFGLSVELTLMKYRNLKTDLTRNLGKPEVNLVSGIGTGVPQRCKHICQQIPKHHCSRCRVDSKEGDSDSIKYR